MSDEPIGTDCPCGGFGGDECPQMHRIGTWTEITPRGVVQVTCDGTIYSIDGVFVPLDRYHEAIKTGIW